MARTYGGKRRRGTKRRGGSLAAAALPFGLWGIKVLAENGKLPGVKGVKGKTGRKTRRTYSRGNNHVLPPKGAHRATSGPTQGGRRRRRYSRR